MLNRRRNRKRSSKSQNGLVYRNVAMRCADARAPANNMNALRTIEGLLDYAILESAELGLPTVVCLLRMARLEVEIKTLREGKVSLPRGDKHLIRLL
jgi:hypothetical protein